jgi:retron-type reverse transcriptase
MKRIGHLFEQVVAFDSLYQAFRRAFKGAGRTEEACRFAFHLEPQLLQLQRELADGSYYPAPYRYFEIFDPKQRTISVADFRDRVVHHAVVGALEPVFEPRFIFDSYATRKGKGTHRAVKRAQGFLGRFEYYLKVDVDKYFDAIDHHILIELVQRKVKDKRLIDLVGRILAASDASSGCTQGAGLPIGNLTSQFFANVYLDGFDHWAKDRMGIKGYLRYMDDMVFFDRCRQRLITLLKEAEIHLNHSLKLMLKPTVTMIHHRRHGLPFLGYRIYPQLLRVAKPNLKRMQRRLHMSRSAWQQGRMSDEDYAIRLQAHNAHLAFADTFQLRIRSQRFWDGVHQQAATA